MPQLLGQGFKSKHCVLCNQKETCLSLEHLLWAYYNPRRAEDTGNLLFSFRSTSFLSLAIFRFPSVSVALWVCWVGEKSGQPHWDLIDPFPLQLHSPVRLLLSLNEVPSATKMTLGPGQPVVTSVRRGTWRGKVKQGKEERFFMMKNRGVIAYNPLPWSSGLPSASKMGPKHT